MAPAGPATCSFLQIHKNADTGCTDVPSHFTLFNFFSQTAIISFCKEVIPDFRHFPTSAFNFSTLGSPSM